MLSNSNPENTAFRQWMDDLNRLLQYRMVPQVMRQKLREYFQQTMHLQHARASTELLRKLSPGLQVAAVKDTYREFFHHLPILTKTCEPPVLTTLMLVMRPAISPPNEELRAGPLYLLNRGVVLYDGRVRPTGREVDSCMWVA